MARPKRVSKTNAIARLDRFYKDPDVDESVDPDVTLVNADDDDNEHGEGDADIDEGDVDEVAVEQLRSQHMVTRSGSKRTRSDTNAASNMTEIDGNYAPPEPVKKKSKKGKVTSSSRFAHSLTENSHQEEGACQAEAHRLYAVWPATSWSCYLEDHAEPLLG